MRKFNPLSALWMAVAREAMVKKTKKELKSIIRDQMFAVEALSTFVTEVKSYNK